MTESEIKEMLKDIIDNDAEYEGRGVCGECRHKRENCDDTCTLTSRLWNKYHLGDEIRSDWEYRKVEKWYVVGDGVAYGYALTNEKCSNIKQFSGTKEECEKWIEEHKTWLKELNSKISPNAKNLDFKVKETATEVCKKILAEVDMCAYPIHDAFTDENGPRVIELGDLKKLIKKLGVEV